MSSEVYGYVVSSEVFDWKECFFSIEKKTGIGIAQIDKSQLYNFCEDILPNESLSFMAFIIGDKPGKKNTTYLTDYQDYSIEANIGLPLGKKQRLNLLIDMFMTVIKDTKASRFVVAINDSSQVDEVKKVNLEELAVVIKKDFEELGLPDCIYDVFIK